MNTDPEGGTEVTGMLDDGLVISRLPESASAFYPIESREMEADASGNPGDPESRELRTRPPVSRRLALSTGRSHRLATVGWQRAARCCPVRSPRDSVLADASALLGAAGKLYGCPDAVDVGDRIVVQRAEHGSEAEAVAAIPGSGSTKTHGRRPTCERRTHASILEDTDHQLASAIVVTGVA